MTVQADVGTMTNAHAPARQGYEYLPAESQLWTLNQDMSVTPTWTDLAIGDTPAQAVPSILYFWRSRGHFDIVPNMDLLFQFFFGEAFTVTYLH
ncbi:unnamed protein product [Tilletia controversa]|uniref:Uncharacterized protein n=3 Tax=Tilletia TaxID=13289 RepID=A0A8X7MSM2_9BASI|nr:hypothetical protein CF336_g3700 [Tilletia laevis]KAE8197937.1 hypothetical protein CF328_g3694 [Tilletia controversa]KAE8261424.1 hypothetical protein A4X03_0g3266 [Tilletia caries]KAE8203046.1 hypothetical protein CF335_g3181 [Tilletia laevis]KAE8247757.1 hypothetical protein A4X06_0g4219 [Tilletia controversa]